MSSTDLSTRLQAASTFLLQSPPGEVNDVFNDVRALVSDDQALEQGILPALEQYNRDQLVVVDLAGKKVLVSDVSRVAASDATGGVERHIDPRSKHSFAFDHMKLTASDPQEFAVDDETESIRASVDKLLDAYVQNHYSDGVSATYALEDPAYPAPVAAQPEDQPAAATSTNENAPAIEEKDAAEVVEPKEELMSSAESLEETKPVEAEAESSALEGVEPEVDQQASTVAGAASDSVPPAIDGSASATAVEEAEAESAAIPAPPPPPRPSRLFALYFVGNKYNPSNYWTGRWRSKYRVDWEKGTLEGEIVVNVHYYEQGNVQLATTFPVSVALPSTTPEQLIASIKSSESTFVSQLNDAFDSLSNDMFRGLRRALPKTKQKLDWTKIGAYRLGSQTGQA